MALQLPRSVRKFLYPIIILAALFSLPVISQFIKPEPKASAEVVTSISASPTSHRDRCEGNRDNDFSIALKDVSFDQNTGTISYRPEIKYQRCNNKQTRAYAIFGKGFCDFLGYYGGGENREAYDCAKFFGSPGEEYDGPSGITCPPRGNNAQCWVGGEAVAVNSNAAVRLNRPTTGVTTYEDADNSGVFTHQIDGWDNKRHRSDSYTMENGRTGIGNVCQYYKKEPALDAATAQKEDRCISPSITVSWTAQWSVSAGNSMTVNGTARGNDFNNPFVAYIGDTVQWQHTLTNVGPDHKEGTVAWNAYQDNQTYIGAGLPNNASIYTYNWVDVRPAGSVRTWTSGPYTLQQSDANRRICQANSASPASSSGSPGWVGTSWLCARVKYYRITPAIDPSNDTFIGEPANASGRINHIGSLEDAHEVKLVAYKYSDTRAKTSGALGARSSSGEAPCSIGALRSPALGFQDCRESTPAIGDYNGANPMGVERPFSSFGFSGPYPLGTTFCFVLSVRNPAERPEDDANWYHSEASCTTSAKKPRVQFLGSDLRVAGSAISVESNIGGTTYGSWVEYGAFSTDINNFVGSGNALREGDTGARSDWSELTFANDENPAMTPYGFYDPLPAPTSAYGYFTSLTRNAVLNDTVIPNGVYDVGSTIGNGLARLGETRGGSVVIRSDENLTISQNITVNNDNLTNADQITQVVIVADNITIDPGVTRIDAWLVTADGGFINTCAGSGALTANGPCREQLVVNGAVYTDQLQLRRTAGSDPESTDDLKRGAEVFNLRPDSVLWSYLYASKGDFPKTDFIQELPPRY